MNDFCIFEIIGMIFCFLGAFIFHFLYDFSNQNYIVGFFSATNESVWEHVKILVFPYIIWAIIEAFSLNLNLKLFFVAKVIGLYVIPILMITLFYTYTGIIGHHILAVDIAITGIVSIVAHIVSCNIYNNHPQFSQYVNTVIIMFVLLLTCIFVFTYHPPELELFKDKSQQR